MWGIIKLERTVQGGEAELHVILKNYKSSLCPNIESIFIDIFLPKSKPISVGVLHRLSDKPRLTEYLDYSLKESNISNIQECYLIGDFNINLLSGNKMLLDKQYNNSYSQAPPLIKKYMDLSFLTPFIN